MVRRNVLRNISVIFTAFLVAPVVALRASCGLDMCPHPLSAGRHGDVWSGEAVLRHATFHWEGISGDYTLLIPRVEHRGWRGWILGGYWPVAALDDGHHNRTGLGNLVLYGQAQPKGDFFWGGQLELPVGDDKHGIAAEHGEILPYVALMRSAGRWMASGRVGYRYALSGGHGHGSGGHSHGVLLVNPHEDRELVYHAMISRAWMSDRLSTAFFLDGQHAVRGDTKGTGFLTAGTEIRFALSPRWDLTASFEEPVTRPERVGWRAGTGLALKF